MSNTVAGFLPVRSLDFNTDPLYGFNADGLTDDTAKFSAMRAEAAFATADVDLKGKTYLVSSVPAGRFHNGYFKLTNLDNSAPVLLPAPRTIDRRILKLDGGRITPGWPQDTMSAYNGVGYLGFMPAFGHNPGTRQWNCVISTDGFASILREEKVSFDFTSTDRIEVFSSCVVPPSTIDVGAYQLAVAQDKSTGVGEMCYRALAEYDQDPTGGSIVQVESGWNNVSIGGSSFSVALRAAVDAAYTVTTSGMPTLVHSLGCVGDSAGASGDVLFGFHGLSGAAAGPYIGYVSGSPKDGSATISAVGRIGLLSNGVEPSVAWYKNGSSARYCGLIRSESDSYPLRFYRFSASTGVTKSEIENAVVQDCPWGNAFGTLSPGPCRMRPRRKGATSGWIATSETLDGSSTDELHFVFSGKRTRDGGPGAVGLYWGRVTRGSGDFADFWNRCRVVKVADLYYSNSNALESQQVGIPSLCFSDANTLHITYNTMRPAVSMDDDAAELRVMTIKLDDAYADTPENWDTGVVTPISTYRILDYISPGVTSPPTTFKVPNVAQRLHVTSNSWLTSTSPADYNWRNITYVGELGLFIAIASNGAGQGIATSPDGETWTLRTDPTGGNDWRGIAWSPELHKVVIVGITGTGNRAMTSSDGITWTAQNTPEDNNWNSVCWASGLKMFVAVASSGTNRVMISRDGETWTTTGAPGRQWISVCWSQELWKLVAVANTGTGNRVMTSINGIVWVSGVTPADNAWRSVCWAPEISKFVAIANTGTGNRVMTSSDGETWILRTSAADNDWCMVCWAPRIGLLAAVSTTGTGNRVMYSSDGETWTLGVSASNNDWNAVAFSDQIGVLAAVSATGTGTRMMTSKSIWSRPYR
jgi:hypothetical protein